MDINQTEESNQKKIELRNPEHHVDENIRLALRFFIELWPKAYPMYNRIPFATKLARRLTRDGVLSHGHLLEKAISRVGSIVRESTMGKDFADKSDAKAVSVRTCSKGKAYSAPVTNIHRKKGYLRVMVFERKQDRFYYFMIPGYAYSHIASTSNIEIPFEIDGDPKRINKCDINWWNYEVDTFNDITRAL